ncbi:1-(5-phosphoribosyl)-5-[(5-phosphoribosylamino)methylideneamino] imidazole-4-carboxamide isomerase [Buchnera aphidicola]|uniref:1-(5-phosphoribosyl)-5-[(5-phosphoribosylamino)methylideneamino] imidazole-4-carboxamide isomerase n=1 Tax=Buchnera aphidicola (Cinara strobi) TaxID=1921549 RepID=A0A3B1DVM5_9GAMM|nr:1-(5-phosphoribosyl)-5-[(5-phosphoribosylamino)methylideneamino] imidazole-4-carboxamide isomerase [Buchnera aphidicola]VAX76313.1 1-(5-phosphoribosyl)-5-[(5-phosphoribosylamino)methylideneamino] imidazole-4-carboxamide isomerase [Buchnera aphidicola (Cinara strobi)]
MIIPSLDFIKGKIVRLYKGNYNKKTFYKVDIYQKIDEYIQQGANNIHLVDLDGSSCPQNRQKEILTIISFFRDRVNFQVGGGIRSKSDIEDLFRAGTKKIVIGTLAILNPDKFKYWLKKYGCENFVLAVDVHINNQKEYKIAINGWKKITTITLDSIINEFLPYGLKYILCTDISRDGTFSGPNIYLYKYLKKYFPHIILQASGGISSLLDLDKLKKNNIEHVIIGRALLESKFTVLEAIQCWQNVL